MAKRTNTQDIAGSIDGVPLRELLPDPERIPEGCFSMLIDARVSGLVKALCSLPGIWTTSSCGGHHAPNEIQRPHDEFYVCFECYRNGIGWRSLALIVYASEQTDPDRISVIPWTEEVDAFRFWTGVTFEIRGIDGVDPDALARQIEAHRASIT